GPLSAGAASAYRPCMSQKDNVELFDSGATALPGEVGGGGRQIFAAPTNAGTLPPVVQYTAANPFGDCTFPSFSPTLTRFVFLCTGDPLANGTSGNRVFAFDAIANQPMQITALAN